MRHLPRAIAVGADDIGGRERDARSAATNLPIRRVRPQPSARNLMRTTHGRVTGGFITPGTLVGRARAQGPRPLIARAKSRRRGIMALASTSPGVTTNLSKEAGGGRLIGPMACPASIGGGGGTVRAGERRGGGPGTPSRPRRVRWRNPRRVAWRMGPDHAEPFSLEGLIFSTHASHKLVYAGHPRSNHSSMPDAVPIPDARATVSGVRGFPDAQSPKAILSRFTRPHRGSRRGSPMFVRRGGRRAEAPRPLPVRTRSEADNVGSPPRASTAPRRARPRGGSSAPVVVRPRVNGHVSWLVDDAHRNPFSRASAGPIGSRTVIALVGAGVDQMRKAALNGPPWTEVGTTVVVFPTREVRSD